MDSNTVREIIKQVQSGADCETGFRRLMHRYQEPLYRCIRQWVDQHEDANDVLQNTFIKVYRNIDGFRGDSALFSWMYRIARNESFTFLRKRKKQARSVDLAEYEHNRAEPGMPVEGDQLLEELKRAMESLPERQRQVFELRYFQAMKYREIAALLGLTEGSLKASFHHAVNKVEDWIKQNTL